MSATNGCAAGTGNDTIRFSVTGTLPLASTLPRVTDSRLTINGPASPGITIDGGNAVQVMRVASGATLNLKNLTIARGYSDEKGGGVLNHGTLIVANSTFSGNGEGPCSEGDGGGGISSDGTLTVTNSTFSRNIAGAGGSISNYEGTLTITKSTFSDNSAGDGGGIYSAGMLTVTNSTFSRNGGGGVENDEGTLTVTNSTFSDNDSYFGTGGIDNFGGSASIKNTILAGNTTGYPPGPSNCAGTITDAGYNISDDATCGFNATGSRNSTNPLLDPAGLQNNGGPTKTIALDSESPAIDVISIANCTDQASTRIITDQRGALRPDVGEVNCDIGAYEFQDLAGERNC